VSSDCAAIAAVSAERLWEAVAPDPCLYPHRHQYNWLSAKTWQLIQENTTFVDITETIPVFKISTQNQS
jgi:type I restriction enzyme R subunit